MTLSDFIDANLDDLIIEWTDYARMVSPTDNLLTDTQLRNSARELLTGIADDMRGSQSIEQQHAKSQGKRPEPHSNFNKIGRGHADDRLNAGFGLNAVVAEFRALRASVLRKWQLSSQLDANAFHEMVRFNEAIDQMLAESVQQFAQRTERMRDLFSGMLAHDLRSPVGAIMNSAHVLLRDENLSPTSVRAGVHLQNSAERVRTMIDDLFVFTRTRLGSELPIEPTPQDLARICQSATDEVCAANPDAKIEVHGAGELSGKWDGARITQMLVNLLTNAVRYGNENIRVTAAGTSDRIVLAVSNEGPPIPASALPTLFDPLTRGHLPKLQAQASSGIGLGLYICRSIASAHHGEISVDSNDTTTVFTVTMPRVCPDHF